MFHSLTEKLKNAYNEVVDNFYSLSVYSFILISAKPIVGNLTIFLRWLQGENGFVRATRASQLME